jgi:hypothetical protein
LEALRFGFSSGSRRRLLPLAGDDYFLAESREIFLGGALSKKKDLWDL